MTEIQNGIYATPTDELTALALEARERKISYDHCGVLEGRRAGGLGNLRKVLGRGTGDLRLR